MLNGLCFCGCDGFGGLELFCPSVVRRGEGLVGIVGPSVGWEVFEGRLSVQSPVLVSESPGSVNEGVQCFHTVCVGHDFRKIEVVLSDFSY